jgi:hypothetical protein
VAALWKADLRPRGPTDFFRLRNLSETKCFTDAQCSKWEQQKKKKNDILQQKYKFRRPNIPCLLQSLARSRSTKNVKYVNFSHLANIRSLAKCHELPCRVKHIQYRASSYCACEQKGPTKAACKWLPYVWLDGWRWQMMYTRANIIKMNSGPLVDLCKYCNDHSGSINAGNYQSPTINRSKQNISHAVGSN